MPIIGFKKINLICSVLSNKVKIKQENNLQFCNHVLVTGEQNKQLCMNVFDLNHMIMITIHSKQQKLISKMQCTVFKIEVCRFMQKY